MKRLRTTALAATATLMLTLLGASTAQAAESQDSATSTTEDEALYAVAPSGKVFSDGADPDSIAPEPDTAQPFLLDPVDLTQCNIRKNESHTITWWTAKRTINFDGGRVDLKCGNAKVGYAHIKAGHQSQWQTRANEFAFRSWDDMMNFAIAAALENPSATYIQTGGKACYTAPIQVRNAQGAVTKTWYPTVVVSMNNKVIISAIPGGGCRE